MKFLLLSNSTNAGEPYLNYPKYQIKNFLGDKSLNAIFVPFAAVTFSFDEYEQKVRERFSEMGHRIVSIHKTNSMVDAINAAEAIIIGGGNTFQLLRMLQKNNLLEVISEKVRNGVPFIGWSAGSNVACPSICTTNDMPIVETMGFKALGLVPFQINPHYSDFAPIGHAGETRNQRIAEYLAANPKMIVVGLWEGTMLRYMDSNLSLIGDKKARIFSYNRDAYDVGQGDDLNFLLD
jgi:dipeptidase E